MSGNQYEFATHLRKLTEKMARDKTHNSAESTGDDEGMTMMEVKLAMLEQNHKKIMAHYQHTIKELMQIIKKQTAVKDQLSQEIRMLGKESQEKKTHLQHLARKAQELLKNTCAQTRQQTVASEYMIEQPFSSKSIRLTKPIRPQLFTSQRLKRTLKASKSQRSIEDDYFNYRSVGSNAKITNKTRQNQRLQS